MKLEEYPRSESGVLEPIIKTAADMDALNLAMDGTPYKIIVWVFPMGYNAKNGAVIEAVFYQRHTSHGFVGSMESDGTELHMFPWGNPYQFYVIPKEDKK
jgi:hypothetical protein